MKCSPQSGDDDPFIVLTETNLDKNDPRHELLRVFHVLEVVDLDVCNESLHFPPLR